mmetsp:Transcript_4286/g.12076  ORF Transcript_4286/g.12076 Transcript_4286/m.12076 type:complete len:246 (-) Transcript_4286:2082-2819(-)
MLRPRELPAVWLRGAVRPLRRAEGPGGQGDRRRGGRQQARQEGRVGLRHGHSEGGRAGTHHRLRRDGRAVPGVAPRPHPQPAPSPRPVGAEGARHPPGRIPAQSRREPVDERPRRGRLPGEAQRCDAGEAPLPARVHLPGGRAGPAVLREELGLRQPAGRQAARQRAQHRHAARGGPVRRRRRAGPGGPRAARGARGGAAARQGEAPAFRAPLPAAWLGVWRRRRPLRRRRGVKQAHGVRRQGRV